MREWAEERKAEPMDQVARVWLQDDLIRTRWPQQSCGCQQRSKQKRKLASPESFSWVAAMISES